MKTTFEQFLDLQDEAAWLKTVEALLPEIHEVDRNAVRIWFSFYPLELFRVLQTVEDKTELIHKFDLQGNYELTKQIDSSHKFLYGHRFWQEVKNAIAAHAEADQPINDLAVEIRQTAKSAAAKIGVNESLLIGIAAVGLMTLTQVGLAELKSASGAVQIDKQHLKQSPEQILAARAKEDSQGLFGFLRTVNKQWTVTWNENDNNAKFKAIDDEEIAMAAARDQSSDWKAADERCAEGVIPVECRSAACGTCWVGVLSGAEKLSDVTSRESKSVKRFGYLVGDEPKPLIRLACQAQTSGSISIVIPPWNGVYGKYLYKENFVEEVLEPATTSAKATRTVLKETTKNQLL